MLKHASIFEFSNKNSKFQQGKNEQLNNILQQHEKTIIKKANKYATQEHTAQQHDFKINPSQTIMHQKPKFQELIWFLTLHIT